MVVVVVFFFLVILIGEDSIVTEHPFVRPLYFSLFVHITVHYFVIALV